MLRFTHFKNCPRCGKTGIRSYQINALKCPTCGFLYFHNTASAVAAIIVDKGNQPRAFALRPNHEIAEIVFVKPDAIDYSAVGFRSMRAALKKYASFK